MARTPAYGALRAPITSSRRLTLDEKPPRPLGLLDQVALWGSFGMSLLLAGRCRVRVAPFGVPAMSLAAALTAVVLGSRARRCGARPRGRPGAVTGAPAMVMLRGLFGRRGSVLPTALNLIQCVGLGVSGSPHHRRGRDQPDGSIASTDVDDRGRRHRHGDGDLAPRARSAASSLGGVAGVVGVGLPSRRAHPAGPAGVQRRLLVWLLARSSTSSSRCRSRGRHSLPTTPGTRGVPRRRSAVPSSDTASPAWRTSPSASSHW